MSGAPVRLRERLASVRLLATDVDGVMTDGVLYYGETGELFKGFHVRDGLGLRMCARAGIEVAVITAKISPGLTRRVADLGLAHVRHGREDKAAALAEVIAAVGCTADEVAFVGDDVFDLPALRQAGVAIAVGDAHPAVMAEADWITALPGGRGALREVADALLEARGALAGAIELLLEGTARPPGRG